MNIYNKKIKTNEQHERQVRRLLEKVTKNTSKGLKRHILRFIKEAERNRDKLKNWEGIQ